MKPIFKNRKGQTALEYLLMIAIVLALLVLVISMTQYVEEIGVGIGGTLEASRVQVIDWLLI